MTINEDRFRDAGHSVINGSGTTEVDNIRVGDPICSQKAEAIARCILKVDAGKDNSLALYTQPGGLEEGRFVFAGVAL